jgi:MoaA/NifB/PqqE/SkfB family radical SAM enzyme
MKLYIIPVGSRCNASCKFCITNLRSTPKKEFLDISDLKRTLSQNLFKKIEITGGGEPLLHPKINEIISLCTLHAPTQLYTNGKLINLLRKNNLRFLCLSRAHHNDNQNKEIMGISYPIQKVRELDIPLKLSLLLHKSGINDAPGVRDYIKWAKKIGATEVVVRQLFDQEFSNKNSEFVSTKNLFSQLKIKNDGSKGGNPIFYLNDIKVEFEYISCSCENQNPILHSDGKLTKDWNSR